MSLHLLLSAFGFPVLGFLTWSHQSLVFIQLQIAEAPVVMVKLSD